LDGNGGCAEWTLRLEIAFLKVSESLSVTVSAIASVSRITRENKESLCLEADRALAHAESRARVGVTHCTDFGVCMWLWV
jgi:hypothetical protein